MNFSLTFDSESRGLISLPCVEVGGEGVDSVTVVIVQSHPREALSNCTVEIIESTDETTPTRAPGKVKLERK